MYADCGRHRRLEEEHCLFERHRGREILNGESADEEFPLFSIKSIVPRTVNPQSLSFAQGP